MILSLIFYGFLASFICHCNWSLVNQSMQSWIRKAYALFNTLFCRNKNFFHIFIEENKRKAMILLICLSSKSYQINTGALIPFQHTVVHTHQRQIRIMQSFFILFMTLMQATMVWSVLEEAITGFWRQKIYPFNRWHLSLLPCLSILNAHSSFIIKILVTILQRKRRTKRN